MNLTIGDRLVRTKGGIFTKHHAIYMGLWNNIHIVAENQQGYGVRYVTLNDFLKNGKLVRIEYNNFPAALHPVIINRVNEKIGKAYILDEYNCEHFVNEILTGIIKSYQIQNAFIFVRALGIVTLLLLFNKSFGNKS